MVLPSPRLCAMRRSDSRAETRGGRGRGGDARRGACICRISEKLLDSLDHEVIRLSSQDVPTAYAKLLEDATIVQAKDVVRAIHTLCGATAPR